MAKKLLFPSEAHDELKRRYERNHRKWLRSGGEWPLAIILGEPTERDVAGHVEHLRQWVSAWSTWTGGVVRWKDVQWPRLGVQKLPFRLELESLEAVATLVGEGSRLARARERQSELMGQWPMLAGAAVVERHFDVLADYPDVEFRRLVGLLAWLLAHPASNLALRELPVEGIDTKWIEKSRRSLVLDFLHAITGGEAGGDFWAVCGLRRPQHRVRMVVLCPQLRTTLGGLRDLEAPLPDLLQLSLAPSRVLVVENQESGLALPDIVGTVAFIKLGASVGALGTIPWLRGIDCVYWGDIDTHGFAILNQARAALGNIKAILMDEPTLLEHRALWGNEPQQAAGVELPNLTPPELALLRDLRSHRWGLSIRLEQERIPWHRAVEVVRSACG